MATPLELISLRINDPNHYCHNGINIPAILHMGNNLKICHAYDAILYTGKSQDDIKLFSKQNFTLRLGSSVDVIIIYKNLLDENNNPIIKEANIILINDLTVCKKNGDIVFYIKWN